MDSTRHASEQPARMSWRSRRGIWLVLSCVVALAAVTVSIVVLNSPAPKPGHGRTGPPSFLPNHGEVPSGVAFSPDGKTIAATSSFSGVSGVTTFWDAATGQRRAELRSDPGTDIGDLAFSPDGRTLAVVGGRTDGHQGWLWLWDVATGQRRAAILNGTDPVSQVAFSPDGKTIATASGSNDAKWRQPSFPTSADLVARDSTVDLWDTATGRHITTITSPGTGTLSAVVFSPDGKTIATAGGGPLGPLNVDNDPTAQRGGYVQVWLTATGRHVKTITTGETQRLWAVAYSPDGKTLAAVSGDPKVWLWDAATGRQRAILPGDSSGSGHHLVFSPDGKTIAAGTADHVYLWDTATGRQEAVLPVYSVSGLAFSPDEKTLAASALTGVRLLNITPFR